MKDTEENRITYLATTDSRSKRIPFGIKRKDRARHTYIIGKTGMGKSTLLENMAIQDIRNGEGIAFIDPHGSSAEKLLQYVPEHRKDDVLYFAPFDMDYPVAFNVMEDVGYDKRHLVVSGLISAFRKIWVDTWSARMEYILSNTILALLEYPGSTLLSVNRMLIDKVYRKKVVENVKDPIVRSFWVDEFATYTDRYTQEATPAIQNKIGQFTSNPLIRNIVGQPKSTFDFREMMDKRKIIIANLSKGRVGEVNAALLGSMLVTKLYLSAMSRADASPGTLAKLPPLFFYVDEFQSFANDSFADILSEARKYNLNLTIAHQYIEQVEENVRNAVFGNVGTTIAFRVGPFDAEVLETVFQPRFMKEDLVNLGFAQIYLTLMIDGVGSQPFSALTLPPFDLPPQTFEEQILDSSRKLYARPRATVEEDVRVWQSSSVESKPKIEIKPVRIQETKPVSKISAGEVKTAPPEQKSEFRPRPPFQEQNPVVPQKPLFVPQKSFPSVAGEPVRSLPKEPVKNIQHHRQERRYEKPGRPMEQQRRPPEHPEENARKQLPPLEGGSTSLAEAIRRAQTSPPVQKENENRYDAKGEDLRAAIAQTIKKEPLRPPEQKNAPHHEVPPPKNVSTGKKNEVPEEVLRNLLKVEGEESV